MDGLKLLEPLFTLTEGQSSLPIAQNGVWWPAKLPADFHRIRNEFPRVTSWIANRGRPVFGGRPKLTSKTDPLFGVFSIGLKKNPS
jgi:hypothetical protein